MKTENAYGMNSSLIRKKQANAEIPLPLIIDMTHDALIPLFRVIQLYPIPCAFSRRISQLRKISFIETDD